MSDLASDQTNKKNNSNSLRSVFVNAGCGVAAGMMGGTAFHMGGVVGALAASVATISLGYNLLVRESSKHKWSDLTVGGSALIGAVATANAITVLGLQLPQVPQWPREEVAMTQPKTEQVSFVSNTMKCIDPKLNATDTGRPALHFPAGCYTR